MDATAHACPATDRRVDTCTLVMRTGDGELADAIAGACSVYEQWLGWTTSFAGGGTADAFSQSRADLIELCVPLAEAIALAGKDGENRRVRGRCEWY